MYVSEGKHFINTFPPNDISHMNFQLKWELQNYEIRKYTFEYT